MPFSVCLKITTRALFVCALSREIGSRIIFLLQICRIGSGSRHEGIYTYYICNVCIYKLKKLNFYISIFKNMSKTNTINIFNLCIYMFCFCYFSVLVRLICLNDTPHLKKQNKKGIHSFDVDGLKINFNYWTPPPYFGQSAVIAMH